MLLQMLPSIMLKCLIITVIIECLLAFILRVKDKKDFLNIILVNLLTNPLLVSLTTLSGVMISMEFRIILTIIMEILAFITEGFVYYKTLKYKKINGFVLSLLLNLASYFIGGLFNSIIW